MLWSLREGDHDWTSGHHLSAASREDPRISNHLQNTSLTSTLVTNHNYLGDGGGGGGGGGGRERERERDRERERERELSLFTPTHVLAIPVAEY